VKRNNYFYLVPYLLGVGDIAGNLFVDGTDINPKFYLRFGHMVCCLGICFVLLVYMSVYLSQDMFCGNGFECSWWCFCFMVQYRLATFFLASCPRSGSQAIEGAMYCIIGSVFEMNCGWSLCMPII